MIGNWLNDGQNIQVTTDHTRKALQEHRYDNDYDNDNDENINDVNDHNSNDNGLLTQMHPKAENVQRSPSSTQT